jgi:putative SOS response-associated peptidase YedK
MCVWAKDESIARNTYNARTGTVAAKPIFRNAFKHRQFVSVVSIYEPCGAELGRQRQTNG